MDANLFPTAAAEFGTTLRNPLNRSTSMQLGTYYRYATEIQRERLRQAERHRLARTALRARRALAQQLMR
jgi:hypothetical protein